LKVSSVKKKLAGLIAVATVTILGCMVTSCVPKTISPTDLADPAQIFSNDCSSCHATDRSGGHGPNIQSKSLTDYTQSSLAAFLSSHKTAQNLTPAQRAVMAGWLKNN